MSPEQNVEPAEQESMTPAKRRRLQQLFDHGTKTSEQAVVKGIKSNFDYANDSFAACVMGDPGNRIYIQALLENLYKKYGNNSAKMSGTMIRWKGSAKRTAVKKALAKKDWDGVIKNGLALLKINPWDATALLPMAEACEKQHFHEAQLAYLKGAWIGNTKSVEVNRTCGLALARRGRYDEAIECWRRVKKLLPNDDEADKAISKLAVDKTIRHGKYDEAESTTDVMADKQAQAERRGEAEKLTPEQKFQKLIAEKPDELGNYLELADIYKQDDRHEEAERVLTQALSVSGGDLKIREMVEDAQVRRLRHQVRIAERRAAEEQTDDARRLVQQLSVEANRLELQVFAGRCERYPSNTAYQYELGVRLRRAGNYNEAIKALQQARNDPKRKGMAHVELGEAFRLIKQYRLAVNAYEEALEHLGPREDEQRKLCLYWAGKVALIGMNDVERAEKHLNALAGLDFSYRDLSAVLDKLAQMQENG